jgi:hypothetical protein
VAALIKGETGVDVELIVGGRGEFSVWVGDQRVAWKDSNGFPEDQSAVSAVRDALKNSPR